MARCVPLSLLNPIYPNNVCQLYPKTHKPLERGENCTLKMLEGTVRPHLGPHGPQAKNQSFNFHPFRAVCGVLMQNEQKLRVFFQCSPLPNGLWVFEQKPTNRSEGVNIEFSLGRLGPRAPKNFEKQTRRRPTVQKGQIPKGNAWFFFSNRDQHESTCSNWSTLTG